MIRDSVILTNFRYSSSLFVLIVLHNYLLLAKPSFVSKRQLLVQLESVSTSGKQIEMI